MRLGSPSPPSTAHGERSSERPRLISRVSESVSRCCGDSCLPAAPWTTTSFTKGRLEDGDGPITEVRLSELFSSSDRPVVIYHLMFTFKYDLASEDADGGQQSSVSVFTMVPGGTTRHFYTAHPHMSEDIDQSGIDLLTPVWHILDLTPQGRDDWYADRQPLSRSPPPARAVSRRDPEVPWVGSAWARALRRHRAGGVVPQRVPDRLGCGGADTGVVRGSAPG